MPPRVKFTKEEIVEAALRVTREGGIDSLTARSLAAELGASTRPMFTYFETVDELKHEVYEAAKGIYKTYIERGLAEPVPFLGVGQNTIRFAREEPELFRLLFLQKPDGADGGAAEALAFSQDLVRDSIMGIYKMDAYEADCYYDGGPRNEYRIIYSNDGHVWYTEDHYNTFLELFPSKEGEE